MDLTRNGIAATNFKEVHFRTDVMGFRITEHLKVWAWWLDPKIVLVKSQHKWLMTKMLT